MVVRGSDSGDEEEHVGRREASLMTDNRKVRDAPAEQSAGGHKFKAADK